MFTGRKSGIFISDTEKLTLYWIDKDKLKGIKEWGFNYPVDQLILNFKSLSTFRYTIKETEEDLEDESYEIKYEDLHIWKFSDEPTSMI